MNFFQQDWYISFEYRLYHFEFEHDAEACIYSSVHLGVHRRYKYIYNVQAV